MALTQKDRQQLMVLLILVAGGVGAGFWFMWRAPKVEAIALQRVELDSLQREVNDAVAALRQGSVGQLRQRVAGYERTLARMRQLVPTQAEVTNLIDQVSTRAQVRGVNMVEWTPLSGDVQPPYTVHRSRFTVAGAFDDVAALLTDVASLSRIMVPEAVGLSPDDQLCSSTQQGDGTCLRVSFELRTFVKSPDMADSTGVGGVSGS